MRRFVEERCEQKYAERKTRQQHGADEGPSAGKVLGDLIQEEKVPFRPRLYCAEKSISRPIGGGNRTARTSTASTVNIAMSDISKNNGERIFYRYCDPSC